MISRIIILAIPPKSRNAQTITNELSNIVTKSKREPLKTESHRGAEFFNNKVSKTSSEVKIYSLNQTLQIKDLIKLNELLELYVI